MPPLTPAQEAQGKIDAMLEETGWQDKTRKQLVGTLGALNETLGV